MTQIWGEFQLHKPVTLRLQSLDRRNSLDIQMQWKQCSHFETPMNPARKFPQRLNVQYSFNTNHVRRDHRDVSISWNSSYISRFTLPFDLLLPPLACRTCHCFFLRRASLSPRLAAHHLVPAFKFPRLPGQLELELALCHSKIRS